MMITLSAVTILSVLIVPRHVTLIEAQESLCEPRPINPKQTWNPNKKVIAFTLFHSNESREVKLEQNASIQKFQQKGSADVDLFRSFVYGARINSKHARLYFPDWIIRIYVMGLSTEEESTLLAGNDNVELVRCSSPKLKEASPSRKMISRFLTHDDQDVLYFLSRDLDSRLNPREMFAVH